MLLVSHDRDEVFRMSDQIAIMDSGEIQTMGTKSEVFQNPRTRKAAILTGCKNISDIEISDSGDILATDWNIRLDAGGIPEGTTALGIRMHDIRHGIGQNSYRCRVVDVVENPFTYTVFLKSIIGSPRMSLGWELSKDIWRAIQADEITISIPPEAILLLKD